jgi:hypothetical protein
VSGIRTGTRLQQLETFRHRVDHEYHAARRRDQPTADLLRLAAAVDDQIRAEGGTPPPPAVPTPPKRKRPPLAVDLLITRLDVPAATVRAWAVEQGLIEPGKRGRVPLVVVEMYAAHQRTIEHARKAGTP